MTTVLAILYFLGIFLHYVHVITVTAMLDRHPDMTKVWMYSAVWPLMAMWYFYNLVLRGDDEDEP